ncbi:MAG: hypothetical protein WAM78_01760 [Candidatus Sulfotelmatobacter sp.]
MNSLADLASMMTSVILWENEWWFKLKTGLLSETTKKIYFK